MSGRDLPSPLLVVTDRHGHPRPLIETVAACLDGGARWVWFRDRDLAPDERRRLGARLLRLVRAAGGALTVGGDAGLAADLGTDGAHLGGDWAGGPGDGPADRIAAARARLGPGARIGVSAHGAAEVAWAAAAGADYATLSPVFVTASKPGYGPALGPAALGAAARYGLPVIALGGVAPGNLAACRAAGAAGAAVMGLAMRAEDPAGAVRRCLDAWHRRP